MPDRADGESDVMPVADPAAVGRAVEATRSVRSARVELRTAYRGLDRHRGGGPGGDAVRMIQRAAFDSRNRQAEAEADMSEMAAVIDAAGETVQGDFRQPTRLVVDGGTFYAQIGPMAEAHGLDPALWIARDLADVADQQVDNETVALLLEPLALLGLLDLPVADVRVLGADDVRGTATTQLSCTVDTAVGGGARGPAADDRAAAPGAGVRDDQVGSRLRRLGVGVLPVTVWVGDDQVVRRLEFSIEEPSAARGAPGAVTTTVEVYEVDEPVEVAVPAPADVVSQAELLARLTTD